MFGSFQIARVYGIPVRLHWTMVLFLPYLALRLAGAMGVESPAWGWVAAIALFASVLLHELGHSLVARGRGYPVRDIILTPIGGVAFLTRSPRRSNDELVIAIAGPLVSIALAVACWVLATPMLAHGWIAPGATVDLIGSINLALFLFNLIPCFPMDGGRVFRAWLTRRVGRLEATRRAVKLGKFLAWAFGLYGLFTQNWILVIIAFVVHQAAAAEYRLVQAQEIPPVPPFNPFAGFGPIVQPPRREPQRLEDDDISIGPPPYGR